MSFINYPSGLVYRAVSISDRNLEISSSLSFSEISFSATFDAASITISEISFFISFTALFLSRSIVSSA